MKKRLLASVLCVMLMVCVLPTVQAKTVAVTEAIPEQAFLTMDFDGVDQRSEFAKENVTISTEVTETYLLENAGNHSGLENQETATFMLDNEQRDGVTEETYLTVVRASSPSSSSEQAGNLTVVAMIYWNMKYSDDLKLTYDIAFIKSGHVYRDAGSSGVYKLYGENYVAFGTYMDSNSNNWSNPTDNRTYTLTNNFSNTYTAAYMNNFTSTAITKVYANSHSPSTLSVSVNKNS